MIDLKKNTTSTKEEIVKRTSTIIACIIKCLLVYQKEDYLSVDFIYDWCRGSLKQLPEQPTKEEISAICAHLAVGDEGAGLICTTHYGDELKGYFVHFGRESHLRREPWR